MQTTTPQAITVTIRPAQASDLPTLLALLSQTHLPHDGLAEHVGTALVACSGVQIVGCAALELHDEAALLRSVAVSPSHQKRGLGHRLTQAALNLARQHGVTQVYLLTETAADFFPRFGFERITRAEVPGPIQQSVEFVSACPQSALVMALKLPADRA